MDIRRSSMRMGRTAVMKISYVRGESGGRGRRERGEGEGEGGMEREGGEGGRVKKKGEVY